ncbi:MAG: hypothetical protein ACJA2X_001995 [Halocynthiibacter sp.]|jgi:hypothetical protein
MKMCATLGNRNANDPTADPQTAAAKSKTLEVTAPRVMPSKTGRVYARLYNNAEKAELGHAEGCKSAPDEWF